MNRLIRLLVAKLVSMMLSLGSVKAEATGTLLQYGEKLVYVDAPCSGIKMLWFALFATCILASRSNLRAKNTLLLFALSCLIAIFANCLRVTSLFYLETGLVSISHFNPEFLHQAIGLSVFALLLVATFYTATRLARNQTEFQNISREKSLEHVSAAKTRLQSFAIAAIAILSITAFLLPFRQFEKTNQRHRQVISPDTLQILSLAPGTLKEVTLEGRHKKFLENFPGQIKVFTDQKRLYIIRWITEPTRKLHPAADCYRGAGYQIEYRPLIIEKSGAQWSHFLATRDKTKVSVKERIVDEAQNQWTEPSSWYWSALLGETKPPWWGITVEEGEL